MGTPTSENTHKHRNIIDDLLDGGLILAAIGYYFLSDKTLALLATGGATLRGIVRRVLMRLWSDKLGITAPAEDAQSTAVATERAESED